MCPQQHRLTDLQRRALHLASLKGGVLVTRRRTATPKTVTTRVANVLLELGFVTRHQETLLITKEGRRALHAVLPEGPPVFLRQRDGLTTRMDQRVREEDEVMSPPDPRWALRAEERRRLDRQEADAARLSGLMHPEERIAELRRLAAEKGRDIRSDLRQLEHVAKRIERKVREDEAA
jgi:hypothetical protein